MPHAPPSHRVRHWLDASYRACGALAALVIVAILALVLVQMASRLFRVTVPGVQDFAAYGVAATAFLALASTLRAGSHVRVNLLLTHLGPRGGRILETWCCALGAVLASYMAYWSIDLVWDSYEFGEVASSLMPTPLWIPRISMAIGTVMLLIAFIDELVHVVRGGKPRYERPQRPTEG